MTPIVLWVVLACGVDAGYEPASDGHLEYIIQIEPQLLGSLAAGHDVTSEVPRGLDVRHYRLTVGTAALPHIPAATAGGTGARAADAFEAPGRADEAIGSTTPQVRVGYELLSAASGKYKCVIEIDPRSLGDLNQSDLTDDIPPGLPVTRFVISTNPGSAPDDKPSGVVGQAILPQATGTVPAMADGGPSTGDDDPSNWQPEAPVTTAVTPPASNGSPPIAAGSAIPDDAPGGTVAPPAAMPPHEELSNGPSSGPASPPQGRVDQPGGFSRKGFATEGAPDDPARAAETSRAAGAAPGRLTVESTAEPLTVTSGVGDVESEAGARVARKADTGAVDSHEKTGAPVAAEIPRDKEKGEPSPTKPWFPFIVTLFALFASLGGNVFLGWVAWDSYNRNRTVGNKIEGRKPSLSS